MGKKNDNQDEELNLIPIDLPEATDADSDTTVDEQANDMVADETSSKASDLFGEYVNNENKWERKNRIKEEKVRKKYEKKRAKYGNVDDETYEKLQAGPVHKFFGVLSVMLLIAGIALTALSVYRLVIAPSYAAVGEKEANIQVEGMSTSSDSSVYEQQVTTLHSIATPSDLVDTWVEEEFVQATPTDVQTEIETESETSEPQTQTEEVQ